MNKTSQLPAQLRELKLQLSIDTTSDTPDGPPQHPAHIQDTFSFSPSLISHAVRLHSNRTHAAAVNQHNLSTPFNIFGMSPNGCNQWWNRKYSPGTFSTDSSISYSNDEEEESEKEYEDDSNYEYIDHDHDHNLDESTSDCVDMHNMVSSTSIASPSVVPASSLPPPPLPSENHLVTAPATHPHLHSALHSALHLKLTVSVSESSEHTWAHTQTQTQTGTDISAPKDRGRDRALSLQKQSQRRSTVPPASSASASASASATSGLQCDSQDSWSSESSLGTEVTLDSRRMSIRKTPKGKVR